MEEVGGGGPDGEGEQKRNFLYETTSQDELSYLRSARSREPNVTPIEGRKLAMGGNRLMKEQLEYQACSVGFHGGP